MTNKILWKPSSQYIKESNLFRFTQIINHKYGHDFDSYDDLYKWSVIELEKFWEEVSIFSNIKFSQKSTNIIKKDEKIWKTKWFLNSKLNYAENLLKNKDDNIAIYFFGENKVRTQITFNELYSEVAKVAHSFRSLGIRKGDRIAGFIPNIPEAIISMLAATSMGAIWSSCSPDFGTDAVLDRFKQINPRIIIASDGYYYKGKEINYNDKLNKIVNSLSSIENVFIANYLNNGLSIWYKLIDNDCDEINFEQVDFNHPLYIMYSSGTTGKPKSIVHSVGGTLVQHNKEHLLHVNLKKNDKIFYYSTCGWMMWNWLVSSLAVGASIVLYDGNPFYPQNDSLLHELDKIDINVLGTSAKYISALESYNVNPGKFPFKSLKSILSTGSVLSSDNFNYIYEKWSNKIQLSSISGGTDIISCFALGNPILPVRKMELQCIGLGMSVKSFDKDGFHRLNNKGELVCDQPFPSMPIGFWNDFKNEKFISTYFSDYKNIWKHGDYISINENGGVIIYGRSDTTLNPGGIRIGTSEIYEIVEKIDFIDDSLAVGKLYDDDERIILFVKLKNKINLKNDLIDKINEELRNNCSPRHVPFKILEVKDIPYTINGKKIEIAVKQIINGQEISNKDSIVNFSCLEEYEGKRL